MILDRAYVHPTLRGHDIGGVGGGASCARPHVWVVGSSCRLPHADRTTPRTNTPRRRAVTRAVLGKAGLERIEACPKLIGQTTDGPALSNDRSELAGIAELQLSVAVNDLKGVEPPRAEASAQSPTFLPTKKIG